MDGIIIIAVIFAIATPFAAFAGVILAARAARRNDALERRSETLERRLIALERELVRRTTPPEGAATAAAVTAPPAPQPAAAKAQLEAEAITAPAEPPKPAASPPPPPAPPAEPKRSLEEIIGARWAVIFGGIALALGGIFLVRYSIEQGWLGPAARLSFGAVFAAALLGFGERLRRFEATLGKPRQPIDIPAIVTSAGAASAFAVIYAAFALYGFIGPALAFPLLGLVAVATLVAAVLHGPILGALGIVGAYAVPALVSSDEPNVWALFIYLFAPTGAAFAVARLRGWPNLALAAGLLAFGWGALASGSGASGSGALIVFAFGLTALSVYLHAGLATESAPGSRPDVIPCVLIALYAFMGAASVPLGGFGSGALIGAAALFSANLAIGSRYGGLAPVAVAGGLMAALTALSFDDAALSAFTETTSFPGPGETARAAGVTDFLSFAGALGAIFLFGGTFAARLRPATPGWWTGLLASAAVATPLLLIAVAYWRISAFEPDIRFAGVTILLAGGFAWLTEDFARRESKGAASPTTTAAFATGAAAGLGLAIAMAMRESALTVALAFLAAALGYVATTRPIRALGWLAIVAAALTALRIGLDPTLVTSAPNAPPVAFALLFGYGAPAAAFWAGSRWFDKAAQRWPSQVLEAMALVFALLLGFMEARCFAHAGQLDAAVPTLVEGGLDATLAFALAVVTARLALKRASPVLGWATFSASVIGVAISALWLLTGANPMLSGEPVGEGALFNDLAVGYLLPAIAALAAARFTGENRPVWFRRALGATALLLGFAYVTLMTRKAFVGETLDVFDVSDAEWWAYSVVWLIFGLALLAVGVVRRSQMLRLGSAIVITLVVFKVFLFDMAGLGGVFRALSFIGLGGVLIGIGLVYQRLLFPKPRETT